MSRREILVVAFGLSLSAACGKSGHGKTHAGSVEAKVKGKNLDA